MYSKPAEIVGDPGVWFFGGVSGKGELGSYNDCRYRPLLWVPARAAFCRWDFRAI